MSKWGWGLLVLAVTGAVYANSLPGVFYFDDFGLMLENPRVSSGFSYGSFLEHYGGRPLTLLSLHWNYRLSGRDPFSFHVVNLALHLTTVLLLYWFAHSWTGNRRLAILASLLFALHPLQSQAVNYVWARSVLLMACFGLLSLGLALRRRPWIALAVLQLAVWSRAEALVLLIPLACMSLRPWSIRSLVRSAYGSALAVMLVFNLASISAGLIRHAPREVAWNHSEVWNYWLQQPAVIGNYFSLMVWPAGLSIDRQWQPWDLGSLLPILMVLPLAAVGVWVWSRRHPVPALSLLTCLLLLLPSGVIPNTVLLSESRAYAAMAGFSMAAAWVLDRSWSRHSAVAVIAAGLVLTACGWRTVQRNRIWNDEISIYREAVEQAPAFDRVHYNLGFALARRGRTGEAEAEFRAARNLNPSDDYSYAAMAYCAEVEGRPEVAERLYRQALYLNPSNAYAREGLMRIEGRKDGHAGLRAGFSRRVSSRSRQDFAEKG